MFTFLQASTTSVVATTPIAFICKPNEYYEMSQKKTHHVKRVKYILGDYSIQSSAIEV